MEWLICLGVVPLLGFVLLFFAGGLYKKVFADAHFHEVAEKLPALKQAALDRAGDVGQLQPPDPRTLLTSVGLAILYTVSLHGEEYHHHLSISLPARGYTAHAVGDMFMRFLAHQLGVDLARLQCGVSRSTVHHGIFILSRAEHEEYTNRAVTLLTADGLKAFREEWIRLRNPVQWERIPG